MMHQSQVIIVLFPEEEHLSKTKKKNLCPRVHEGINQGQKHKNTDEISIRQGLHRNNEKIERFNTLKPA